MVPRPATRSRLPAADHHPGRRVHQPGQLGAADLADRRGLPRHTHGAASAEAPLAWRLPFRVGAVVVDSHLDGGALRFDYPLDLAPFVDARGASTVQIRKSASLAFGRRTRLELPSR